MERVGACPLGVPDLNHRIKDRNASFGIAPYVAVVVWRDLHSVFPPAGAELADPDRYRQERRMTLPVIAAVQNAVAHRTDRPGIPRQVESSAAIDQVGQRRRLHFDDRAQIPRPIRTHSWVGPKTLVCGVYSAESPRQRLNSRSDIKSGLRSWRPAALEAAAKIATGFVGKGHVTNLAA